MRRKALVLSFAVVAASALLSSQQVGSAQQPMMMRIVATGASDLRTWDAYVTSQQRAGTLRPLSVERDPSLPARVVERLQQYYDGVPVWGAQVVRDSDSGVAESIFGEVSQPLSLRTTPTLSVADAEQRVIDLTHPDARILRRIELTILLREGAATRLAYMTVVSASFDVVRIFIDAESGAELLRYSELHSQSSVGTGRGLVGDMKKLSVSRLGGLFVADDKLRPPALTTFDLRGNLARAVSVVFDGTPLLATDVANDSDNEWTDIPTIDAHTYIGWTYDYYFKRHGRRGLDNRDWPLVSIVNGARREDGNQVPANLFGLFVTNAFWCDDCGPGSVGVIYFGNGFPAPLVIQSTGQNWGFLAGSLDVVAHELTHGVTSSSSNLIYMNESGALNEAFSDIMGTSVEYYYEPAGTGLGEADFLLAEDSVRSPSAAGLQGIRSMVNPRAFGHPDHYSIRFTGTGDNGGVHVNSGIPNHAFYLAIIGGVNRTSGLSVTGVGIANRDQIEKIFYRAFVFLLPANATFATARAATLQAARDLYGPTSAALTAVTQAWTAVGVN